MALPACRANIWRADPRSTPSLSLFFCQTPYLTHTHEHTQSSAQSKDIWFIEVVKAANCWGNRRKTIIVARVCRAAKNAKLTGQLHTAYILCHMWQRHRAERCSRRTYVESPVTLFDWNQMPVESLATKATFIAVPLPTLFLPLFLLSPLLLSLSVWH